MESMRSRAKQHLPHVLLTLLSIIQALALELFWAEVLGLSGLYVLSWSGFELWLQVAATFLGILVIWMVYATTVMRFSWVPGISDSIVPFFIGVVQFMLIESMGRGSAAAWFFCLALTFGVMHGEAHLIMRRARRDPDNAEFFEQIEPASFRDFVAPAIMVGVLIALAVYAQFSPSSTIVIRAGLIASFALMVWHLVFLGRFWKRTMGELKPNADPNLDPDHADGR